MSEPWRVSRHTDPLRHTPRGTTDSDPVIVPSDDGWATAAPAISNRTGGYWPRKRLMPLAVLLAIVTGPLGLFYVSLLNGVAALVILPVIVPALARMLAWTIGGDSEAMRNFAVPILWCFTIPWAVIGVRMRNARIDREDSMDIHAASAKA